MSRRDPFHTYLDVSPRKVVDNRSDLDFETTSLEEISAMIVSDMIERVRKDLEIDQKTSKSRKKTSIRKNSAKK